MSTAKREATANDKVCDWCGRPASGVNIRSILTYDASTEPATPVVQCKSFQECDHCWKMETEDLLSHELHADIPHGKLIAKRCADPDYPGIEIWFLPKGESKPIHIISVEDYTQPVEYGRDAPEEYKVPDSRRSTMFCEIDRHDVPCITPGLMCRVWPRIYSEMDDSSNVAFDHIDYRQLPENAKEGSQNESF